MPTPSRFPNGLTNVGKSNPLGMYGAPDPTKWHTYFTDFDTYAAAEWTITAIGTGSSALTDIDGGALLITNSAADNDGRQHQKVGESFLLAAGKRALFKTRFKVSDATQSDLLIGLAVTDTTLLGATAGAGVTDGIFFAKDDGAATLNFYCQKNATTGQTSASGVATLVDDTFITASWDWDGVSEVRYFIDGAHKGTLTGVYAGGASVYLPDTELTVSVALLNGEAVAKTMTIDYLFAAQER